MHTSVSAVINACPVPYNYRKSSIKPQGGLFIFCSPKGGLNREGAY